MNDLDFRAQAIVDAARDAEEPSPADRDRIKRAILVQVAAGALAATAATTAAAGTVGMGVGMKIGVAVLALSLAGGGTAGYLHWQGKSHRAAATSRQVGDRAPAREVPAPAIARPAVAESPLFVPAPTESKARKPDKPRKLAGPGNIESEGIPEVIPVDDQLNSEVVVLKRAREELRLGRPVHALEALQEYDRRFGKGVLGEERQAMAAIAACQAHPGPSSQAQAQAFMRTSPHSPLLGRVRAACITPSRADSP
jgi:hypothetical protein